MTGTPEYKAWQSLKDRCQNPRSENYEHYGARGITVCNEWSNSFENFFNTLGARPSESHSIERIDVNGNYEPGNCTWATIDIQNSNKRTTILYDYCGERLTLSEIARRTGFKEATLRSRISAGKTLEQALSMPGRQKYWLNGAEATLAEWAVALNIPFNKLYSRVITLGWSLERAIRE